MGVGGLVLRTDGSVIIGLREKPGSAQYHYRQASLLVHQLAQALGHELAHPIDILRLWNEILGHPSGRLRTDGRQRQAERARGADVDKTIDACVQSCLEQNQRSRDVRVDEVLPGVSCDMRLVERGRMDDRLR